jgi:hypothetical protein
MSFFWFHPESLLMNSHETILPAVAQWKRARALKKISGLRAIIIFMKQVRQLKKLKKCGVRSRIVYKNLEISSSIHDNSGSFGAKRSIDRCRALRAD